MPIFSDIRCYAKEIRLLALELCYTKRSSHLGGSFSIAELLAVLYRKILTISPETISAPERDRLYYSKGHACMALYAALALRGFFERQQLLENFTENGSPFTSHVTHHLPGVELSTGSLGHALGVSCGSAIASKRLGGSNTIVTLVSDGELDEGSNWEAILFAAHQRLDNLICIVDYNKIQSFGSVSEVTTLEPLVDKFRAFNWSVDVIDGHSVFSIYETLDRLKAERLGRPKCVIAHTVKGKGVSFMENKLEWHYRSPSKEEFLKARSELEKEL